MPILSVGTFWDMIGGLGILPGRHKNRWGPAPAKLALHQCNLYSLWLFFRLWPQPNLIYTSVIYSLRLFFCPAVFLYIGPAWNMIITQAPDVRLRRWLVHSTAFFKTKKTSILPMLKTKQIRQFTMWRKMYKYKKHDFSRPGPPAGQRGQNWPALIFNKNHIFQFRLFYFFLASWPLAVFVVVGLRLFWNYWPPAVFLVFGLRLF